MHTRPTGSGQRGWPPPRAWQRTRRHFLQHSGVGLGAVAYACLRNPAATAATALGAQSPPQGARAKHVIYLHMAGSPPQQELFDNKPALRRHNMQP